MVEFFEINEYVLGVWGECEYRSPGDYVVHRDPLILRADRGSIIKVMVYEIESQKTGIRKHFIAVGVGNSGLRSLEDYVNHMPDRSFLSNDMDRKVYKVVKFCFKTRAIFDIKKRKFVQIGRNKSKNPTATAIKNKALETLSRLIPPKTGLFHKQPIISLDEQLRKLEKWEQAYQLWNYPNKQGFPKIDRDVIKYARFMQESLGDGHVRPVIEMNFYLSTLEEHMAFVMQMLWIIEFGKRNRFREHYSSPMSCCVKNWPGKIVKPVGIDLESSYEKCLHVPSQTKDQIHVEAITHVLYHPDEYVEHNFRLIIPGLKYFIGEPSKSKECHSIRIEGDRGFSNEYFEGGFVPERIS